MPTCAALSGAMESLRPLLPVASLTGATVAAAVVPVGTALLIVAAATEPTEVPKPALAKVPVEIPVVEVVVPVPVPAIPDAGAALVDAPATAPGSSSNDQSVKDAAFKTPARVSRSRLFKGPKQRNGTCGNGTVTLGADIGYG